MRSDGLTMCSGTVALVALPFVDRIFGTLTQFDHEPVSRDLGDDGSRGHGRAITVAFHLGGDRCGNRHVGRIESTQSLGDVVVRSVENGTDPYRPPVIGDSQLTLHFIQRAQRGHAQCV